LTGAGCLRLSADYGDYVDRQEKRFPVTGVPDISITADDASIAMRAFEGSEVVLIVERRSDTEDGLKDISVDANQASNRVTVNVRRSQQFRGLWYNHRSARVTLLVPESSNISANSGDGSLETTGIRGHIVLHTDDGSVRGERLNGKLDVTTNDGSIRLEGVNGTVDAATEDGSIVTSGQLSGLRLRSSDGSVTVRLDRGSQPSADWEITTKDGSVRLSVPDDFNADLDAHTGDGTIRINTPGHHGNAKPSLTARLGSGGRTVRLRTNDGAITVQ
jgi:hypothetical protein